MLFRRRAEAGTTLTGVVIVVLIAGAFLAGVFASLRAIDRERQEKTTRQHMQQITNALSVYYQKHNRLPCPAEPDQGATSEPFGAERGSGLAGDQPGSCTGNANLLGIVPFRALGLSEREVQDGWRRFITYRVAESVATSDPLAGGSPPRVHDLCRVQCVWICPGLGSCGGGGPAGTGACGGVTGQNLNPEKAVQCCPEPESGFDVRDRDGNTLIPDPGSPTSYANINSVAPPSSAGLNEDLPDILAIVLVSHGPNGHGAFLGDGTRLDGGDVGTFEVENADADGLFVLTQTIQPEAGYFDDIVVWRTKHLLFSEVGGYRSGCEDPPLP